MFSGPRVSETSVVFGLTRLWKSDNKYYKNVIVTSMKMQYIAHKSVDFIASNLKSLQLKERNI